MQDANKSDRQISSSTIPASTSRSEFTGYGGDDLAQILAGRRAKQNAAASNVRHELASYIAEGLVTPEEGTKFSVLGWWKVRLSHLLSEFKYTFLSMPTR